MKPVFGKEREVGYLARVEAPEQPALRIRRRSALIVAILQRVIEI